ncbi:MAG: cell division protein ZapA [Spirosomaceae bacterium]|jgi:cell division protein ZapA (FtsZ GTPase activity inhibitor)|nr:cell division protein ZapA [Spirosomataceae bacterium]
MADTDKISFNLTLNGKDYPLTMSRADEGHYRTAASMIDERISQLSSSSFGGRLDQNEIIAFVALEAMVDALRVNGNYHRLQTEVQKYLDEIESKLPSQSI